MSTLPGHDSWRDAGLREPDQREVDPEDLGPEAASLVEEVQTPDEPPSHEALAEDYRPRTARPDLDGEANEADVVEQSEEVEVVDEGGVWEPAGFDEGFEGDVVEPEDVEQ
ncbi:hypothetical protein [Puerhibacterium puerhi]|uniref:hypothetical protein n=1 Tax=Puerhibacterium puerhi TaxID=2692623 RepID=UPI001914F17B|nr:hypothetical protein [Puerhibacterium puerhi]